MTLGRLVLAWLPVAAWFALVGWAAHRWVGVAAAPAPSGATIAWTGAEAVVATLIASLWFDSLGHGAWWLLFGLFGVLASGFHNRPPFVAVILSIVRYITAGAILSWRLG
jgi:hypothetical protein